MTFRLLVLAIVGVLFLSDAVTSSAVAALSVRYSTGGPWVTVNDGGAGDSNPLEGGVAFGGIIDWVEFTVVLSTSKPQVGSAEWPVLDISVYDVYFRAGGGGALKIEVTDTDFGPSRDPLGFHMGMTSENPAAGSVTYKAWVDTDNVAFGLPDGDESIGTLGPTTPGTDFFVQQYGEVDTDGNYSVTAQFTIQHPTTPQYQVTSFDASLAALPEPASMGMWGLLGVVFAGSAIGRRWRNRQT